MDIVRRWIPVSIALAWLIWSPRPLAAEESSTCFFESGKGIRVQYTPGKDKLNNGTTWTPGDKPFLLFTDTTISVGGTTLPIGAYGLYVIPGKDKWILIVNKDVKGTGEYNKAQDLARTTMEFGELGRQVDQTKVVLGRLAGGQCTLRIYAADKMAWGEVLEK